MEFKYFKYNIHYYLMDFIYINLKIILDLKLFRFNYYIYRFIYNNDF